MVISSISYNQHEIISNIISLHTGPIECDVTYGNGSFYKKMDRPPLCFDLDPKYDYICQADCTDLPLPNESVSCLIFDPPFTGSGRVRDSIIKTRFACEQKGVPALLDFYLAALGEFYRVVSTGGWLIFKCQDVVESGKNYFSHVTIYNQAVSVGFKPVDLFILLAKSRLPTWHMKTQRHARKFHCYFWVMRRL